MLGSVERLINHALRWGAGVVWRGATAPARVYTSAPQADSAVRLSA